MLHCLAKYIVLGAKMKDHKVILILIDGMRPDALNVCGNSYVKTLLSESAYTLTARTVMPSWTLPCHLSLFQSVSPERHGVLSNTFTPSPRPVPGLCECLRAFEKRCGFFYSWGELRDLARPDSLAYSEFINMNTEPAADDKVTISALKRIREEKLDFAFIYQGISDCYGHNFGWMSEQYLNAVSDSLHNVEKLIAEYGNEYMIMVTADHGGHERTHGQDIPEDMKIPVIVRDKVFAPGEMAKEISILDIAPTIAALLNVKAAPEWEGQSLL